MGYFLIAVPPQKDKSKSDTLNQINQRSVVDGSKKLGQLFSLDVS